MEVRRNDFVAQHREDGGGGVMASRRVLLLSEVERLLKSEHWVLCHSTKSGHVFQDPAGEMFTVPRHPTRPDYVYLEELLQSSPASRNELVDAALDECALPDDSFDLFIDPGRACHADIQNLLYALSELNQAAGGAGLTFRTPEVAKT